MKRAMLAALMASALVVSGCGKKATGQTVAVVNGEEISQGELNAELQAANVPASADRKQVTAQLLQRIVDRKLLAQAAVKDGIDKTPEYISRQRRMNEELLIGMLSQRRSNTVRLPAAADVNQFIAANPAMFANRSILSLNQISFDPPADGSVATQLKDAHSLDAVAEILTSRHIAFARGTAKLDTASVPPQAQKQIDSLPAGEPFIVPSNGKIVISVITGREPAPVAADQAPKIAAEMMRRQQLGDTMQKTLAQLHQSAKIEYQAGYAPPPAAKPGK